MAQSKRKFYKTEIKVIVLSEDPYNYESLSQVAFDIEEGECSGQVKVEKQSKLSGELMAQALQEQGSDPQFFQLTEEGEDIDE
jgi:hypothetical protein